MKRTATTKKGKTTRIGCPRCMSMGVVYYYPERKVGGRRQKVIRTRTCPRCRGTCEVVVRQAPRANPSANPSANAANAGPKARGSKGLGVSLLEWHGGQGSALYAVGSSFYADHAVPSSLVEGALGELARTRKGLRLDRGDATARAELSKLEARLKRTLPTNRSRRVSAGELEAMPFARVDGMMGKATAARVRRLVRERFTDDTYSIAPGARPGRLGPVLKRRLGHATSTNGRGRDLWEVPRDKLANLAIALVRSGDEEEAQLGSDILYTLRIEVV